MNRLVSLDFFRGLTIALMIIVNTPGSWSHVYPPLLHAEWHGVTPTDLVFPFFLFIVGVSIALAYANKKAAGNIDSKVYIKIVQRTIKIILLGLFLTIFPEIDLEFLRTIWDRFREFELESLRIVGVLFRIALVFLACAILYLQTSWRTQLWIGVGLLVGYWICMSMIPFGNSVAGTLEPGDNFAAWVDQFITPGKMYRTTWDPEGLFSTLPAIGTGITGLLVGQVILNQKMEQLHKIIWIFSAGLLVFMAGYMWSYIFPANKHIWTSSYVLWTSGLAAMCLAVSMWIIDVQGYQRWTKLGVVFGMNAITAYVLHGIVWRIFKIPISGGKGIMELWMEALPSIGIAPKLASFGWAVAYMLLIYLFALFLYRKKIFIKV